MSKKTVAITVGLIAILVVALWGVAFLYVFRFAETYFSPASGSDFHIRFGTVEEDADGSASFKDETLVIPLRYKDSGFRYGLEIVPPDNRSYTYYCIFHFSAPPKVLSGELFESNTTAKDLQTTATTWRGPAVEDYWFDPGDPSGEESIDVFINGNLAKTISYKVLPSQ